VVFEVVAVRSPASSALLQKSRDRLAEPVLGIHFRIVCLGE